MDLMLSFIFGGSISIILAVCLNHNKFSRNLGLILGVICIVIMFNHDGSFLQAINNYDFEDIPFMLGLMEGTIELTLISFPVVRAIVGFYNLVKNATSKQQQDLTLLAKIIRLFMS